MQIQSIKDKAFYTCSDLSYVSFGTDLKTIGDEVFYGDAKIQNIKLQDKVESIGKKAFFDCTDVTNVEFGKSVKGIDEAAFGNCPNIEEIISLNTSAPVCASGVFDNVDKFDCMVYVPAGSVDNYANAAEWSDFFNIEEYSAGEGEDYYNLQDGVPYAQSNTVNDCDIIYTRTFNNKDWQPLYVPFEMSYEDWKDDFEVAYVNNFHQYDTDGDDVMDKMQMEIIKIKNGSIFANRPYLIKAKTTGEKTLTLENKTLYPAEENSIDCSSSVMKYTFTGTYSEVKGLKTKGYYIMSGGNLCMVDNDDVVLKPFRWYMEMEERGSMVNNGGGAMAKIMSIEIVEAEEDDATGILATPKAEDAEDNSIYDMSGRKVSDSDVNALSKGMYIKNNKKFIVK